VKIIATIDGSKFLVEATETELSRVMGYGWTTQMREKGHKLEVGKEIKVNDLWQALEVTRGRVGEVAALAEGLRKTAARVDSVNATLAAPLVEVTKT